MYNVRITECLDKLRGNSLQGGGFAEHTGEEYRPDATEWAILALSTFIKHSYLLEPARSRLESSQLAYGQVTISQDHPDTIWPTPLAILAWEGSTAHHEAQSKAVRFVIETTGLVVQKSPDNPVANDTTIRGWPWTANAFSWVEPTSLSLLALQCTGHSGHVRAQEAVKFLLDRQLPHGGWNYGNTIVYGQELLPHPHATGIALAALAGLVPESGVRRSIDYLKTKVQLVRTPLSLGWGILGLSAWNMRPIGALNWISESLDLQNGYGLYGTTLISLLLLAYRGEHGLLSLVMQKEAY